MRRLSIFAIWYKELKEDGMGARVGELRELPGPEASVFIQRLKEVSATTTQDFDSGLFLSERADGSFVWDVDDNEYLDFCAGVGVANLGHRNLELIKVLIAQLFWGGGIYDANVIPNKLDLLLKEKLASLAPGNFAKKVFLCNSGTEAVEAALKLCFDARPERRRMIALLSGFHGRTLGSLPLMGGGAVRKQHYPEVYPCHHFPFPDNINAVRKIREAVKLGVVPPKDVNAVFLELVQGEGGVNPINPEALAMIMALCKEYDWLLVADEVQTGLGRTGKFLCCEHLGIEPDIVTGIDIITTAKALSGGLIPMGAVIFRSELDWKEFGRHSNTFGGGMPGCAVALKAIEIINRAGFLDEVEKKGKYLLNALRDLTKNVHGKLFPRGFIRDVRGLGLMVGVEFGNDFEWGKKTSFAKFRRIVQQSCLAQGLILITAGNPDINPVLRFMPPLTIAKKEIDTALDIFAKSLAVLSNH